jgi:hypothetical protein
MNKEEMIQNALGAVPFFQDPHGEFQSPKTGYDARRASPLEVMIRAAFEDAETPEDAWNQIQDDIECLQRAQATMKE